MRSVRFLLISNILAFLIHFSAFSQDDSISINTIVEKAQKLSTDYPVEKVYLHFDKPYYAVGDTMWFKAYITTNLNFLSPLSKVVYIDMIGENDSLITTVRIPAAGGVAPGSMVLSPMTYKQGNYHIRAYTKWMYNMGTEYFFNKTIPVGNTMDKQLTTHIVVQGDSSARGARLNAKISFMDENGKPYAGRRVNWKVLSNFETIDKGKGVTDQDGNLAISSILKSRMQKGGIQTDIAVSNEQVISSSFPVKPVFKKPDIQFFPEGGRLIVGISSSVGFKAIKPDGLGIEAKGTVTDNTGNTVCNFSSQHIGMGVFNFTPESDKTYKANVAFADGTTGSYDLPRPRTSGIAISVNNSNPDALAVRIAASQSYLERHQGEPFYLVARNGEVVCYAAQTRLQNQVYSASIPKEKLPPGIVQITLFTSSGSPVSERIAFIIHQNAPTVTLSSDKPVYATRQKVKLNVTAKYPSQPVEGTYSISVVDESKVPVNEDSETTILSSLLLSSELKGYLEKPNYYFSHTNEKKLADLDLLMLTQGYRSYSYRDLLEDKYPAVNYLPEQGIEISGTLRYRSGMPVNKGTMQFILPEKNISLSTQTDAEGKFRFTNLVFPDSVKAILSARSNVNSKNMMIMVDGEAFPAVTPNGYTGGDVINIDSTLHAYLQNSRKVYRTAVVLKEVVIKAKTTPKPSHTDYPALSGLSMIPDQLIPGDRFKGCPVLLDCLKSGTMGLVYADENFYVNRDYNSGSRVPVQVFLNGMPVDANNLSTVNSGEVESVEVFLKDELGTVNRTYNTNGVLVVNMKKAPKGTPMKLSDLQELLPQSNLINFNPMGYLKAREFYSPKYGVQKSGPVTNDLRSTIYWNPAVITDKTGNASVEFFNADGKGPYRAVIEGIDREGNIERSVYRYTVK